MFVIAALTSNAAHAKDANGNFAIKGGGLQTCENFTKAMDARTSDVALYGGWVEGFVTAQNQHSEKTYDLTPWQTTATLLELTKSFCTQAAPNTRFIDAFAGVFRAVVGVSNGEANAIVYREILKRVQHVLRDKGYDVPDQNGEFNGATIAQLMDFQLKNGLVASGLPDQPTLYALFFKYVAQTNLSSRRSENRVTQASTRLCHIG